MRTETVPTSQHGTLARRYAPMIVLGAFLVCAVVYGVDSKQDNDTLHVANGTLRADLADLASQKESADARVATLEDDVSRIQGARGRPPGA